VPARIVEAGCGPVARPFVPEIASSPPGAGRPEARCVLLPACAEGQARDLATGVCLSRREVRLLAAGIGLPLTDADLVSCEKGTLVAATPRLACLLDEPSPPAAPAPSGASGERSVVTWLATHVGPDGGRGAPAFCEALSRLPSALATGGQRAERTGADADADVTVVVTVPANDLSQVSYGATSPDLELARELDRAVGPRIEALRTLGGFSRESFASSRVRCVRRVGRPILSSP